MRLHAEGLRAADGGKAFRDPVDDFVDAAPLLLDQRPAWRAADLAGGIDASARCLDLDRYGIDPHVTEARLIEMLPDHRLFGPAIRQLGELHVDVTGED